MFGTLRRPDAQRLCICDTTVLHQPLRKMCALAFYTEPKRRKNFLGFYPEAKQESGNPSSGDYKTLYLVYSKTKQLSKHRHFAQPGRTGDMQQLVERG